MKSYGLGGVLAVALALGGVAWGEENGMDAATGFTAALMDVPSTAMDMDVPTSVLLPPGFQGKEDESLPLLVWLHGGGGDRSQLPQYGPWLDDLLDRGEIPRMVLASFSSTPFSGFLGAWERFIADELPAAMAERYGTRTDREGLAIAGISMGGYGALKSAFREPGRFIAVGAMEPALEPTLSTLPNFKRNTWIRGPAPSLGEADNPARQAHDNADAIRASGISIYLEVGDEDYLNLHDGTEFVHRVLWDHDIRHEYHLVRWADHVGASMRPRFGEMLRFIATAYAGGRDDPVELPLTEDEERLLATAGQAAAEGKPTPAELTAYLSGPRGPTVHAQIWSPMRAAASDPDLDRAYGKLPPTKTETSD